MKTLRDKKVAEEIRREISHILHYDLGDPRIQGATVTGVRVTPDLKLARIYFAMPGCEDRATEVQAVFKKSAGYIRRLLAQRIRIKYMPALEFFYDESLELETRIRDLFEQISDQGKTNPSQE